MEKKEVRIFIERLLNQGKKINEIRDRLTSAGISKEIIDEMVDEVMFNAPDLTDLKAKETPREPSPQELLGDMNTKPEYTPPAVKKPEIKIINPNKVRRKKLIVNSILLIIFSVIIIIALFTGYSFWKKYEIKMTQEVIQNMTKTTAGDLVPLKDLVLKVELEVLNSKANITSS